MTWKGENSPATVCTECGEGVDIGDASEFEGKDYCGACAVREEEAAYDRLVEEAAALGIPTSPGDPRTPRTVQGLREAIAHEVADRLRSSGRNAPKSPPHLAS